MRKKQFTLFLALVLSVGTMFAESGTCGKNLTWDFTDGVLTISGTGDMDDWLSTDPSPWDLEGLTYEITEVVINNGVTTIGDYAFEHCTGLTSVSIPNSVTSIGQWAFSSCHSLTSIEIPNSVTSIGLRAFNDCIGLTSITIPNSVTSVGNAAFFGCTNISSPIYNAHLFIFMPTSRAGGYAIPNGIKSIVDNAFYDCTGLTSVTIPNTVTSIGNGAFARCTSLTSIAIPNSVTLIGKSAFKDCNGLTSVTIGNGILRVKDYAFQDCVSLTSVNINDISKWCNIQFDSKDANPLYYAHNLYLDWNLITNLIIPKNLESIGKKAFYACYSLTSVEIPNNVNSIEMDAFNECSNLISVTCFAEEPPSMGVWAFKNIGENPKLYVPKQSIEAYTSAFYWEDFSPNIFPISAEETTSTEVAATPDDNSVSLSWPFVDGADIYINEIVTNGEPVCTLTFDAQGQLLTSNFAMPACDGHPREAQTAIQTANGWQYTVNGLDPATNYTYSITAKQGSSVLFTQSVEFHTNWLEPINNVQSDKAQSTKILRGGQLFIERNGHTYDAKGQEVK